MRTFYSIIPLLLTLSSPLLALPPGLLTGVSPDERECLALRERIEARQLLRSLALSDDRQKLLATLARERLAQQQAIVEARSAAGKAVLEAMTRLRDAVLASNGVPDDVKAAVWQAEAPYKRLIDRFEVSEATRERDILALLDRDQLSRLKKPPFSGRGPRASNAPEPAGTHRVVRLLAGPGALGALEGREVPVPFYDEPPDLRACIDDIRVLNLVNALYLTPEQAAKMLPLIEKTAVAREAARQKMAALARRLLPNLRELDRKLAGGTQSQRERTGALWEYARERWDIADMREEVESDCLEALKTILTPNQHSMIADFVPCVVPVRNLTNPERVGQAGDNSGLERALDRARGLPAQALPRFTGRLKDRITELFRRRRATPAETEAVVGRVEDTIREARSLDETTWQLKRAELAGRLALPTRTLSGNALDRRIAEFLLAPNLAPILKSRFPAGGPLTAVKAPGR